MIKNPSQSKRIAIIGAGHVGSTCAYALLLRGLFTEMVLVSKNRERAEGEAMDLNHGMLFARPARIWAGDYSDCAEAEIIIIAAGVAQVPGENRMDLLRRNADLMEEIIPQITEYNRDAILIIVTNPVDVMTQLAGKLSGFPSSRVIGSGTVLDSARLRYLLSQHLHVEPRCVHAFVIGEHGDSQVVVWSLANVAGIRLDEYGKQNGGNLDAAVKKQITELTRRAAYDVIQKKGATYYAIAAGVSRIVEAIMHDENSVLTVSSLVEGIYELDAVSMSLPRVINRYGVYRTFDLPLNPVELGGLQKSAQKIREAFAALGY